MGVDSETSNMLKTLLQPAILVFFFLHLLRSLLTPVSGRKSYSLDSTALKTKCSHFALAWSRHDSRTERVSWTPTDRWLPSPAWMPFPVDFYSISIHQLVSFCLIRTLQRLVCTQKIVLTGIRCLITLGIQLEL